MAYYLFEMVKKMGGTEKSLGNSLYSFFLECLAANRWLGKPIYDEISQYWKEYCKESFEEVSVEEVLKKIIKFCKKQVEMNSLFM